MPLLWKSFISSSLVLFRISLYKNPGIATLKLSLASSTDRSFFFSFLFYCAWWSSFSAIFNKASMIELVHLLSSAALFHSVLSVTTECWNFSIDTLDLWQPGPGHSPWTWASKWHVYIHFSARSELLERNISNSFCLVVAQSLFLKVLDRQEHTLMGLISSWVK